MTDRQEEPATEAGRTLRSFACWEFHAFQVDAHNASCGRTLELILAIEREAPLPAPLDVPTFRARAETWDAKTAGDAQERAYNRGYAQALDDVATELEGAPNE